MNRVQMYLNKIELIRYWLTCHITHYYNYLLIRYWLTLNITHYYNYSFIHVFKTFKLDKPSLFYLLFFYCFCFLFFVFCFCLYLFLHDHQTYCMRNIQTATTKCLLIPLTFSGCPKPSPLSWILTMWVKPMWRLVVKSWPPMAGSSIYRRLF